MFIEHLVLGIETGTPFAGLDEVSYVRSKMDSRILQGLEQNGFVSFGIAEGGFAYIMSLSPIKSVSDLRLSKAWVPSSDEITLEAVNAYGVQPIPLPLGDVLTGLQTGLIDTVAAPPIATLALHWHTQVRYLTDMPILYSSAFLIIDKKAFAKLSKQDQQITRDIMGRVFKKLDKQFVSISNTIGDHLPKRHPQLKHCCCRMFDP